MTALAAPDAGTARRPVESRDPFTGEVWARYDAATAEDVRAVVARARAAQTAWAAEGVAARARVLERFRRVLFARRAEVADVLRREVGKPASEALGSEVSVVLDFARFYARIAPKALRSPWTRPRSPAMWRKRVRVEHAPFGVIAVVSPWNYPFMLAAGAVLPALVAGNAVVLKPSEYTPGSALLLASLLHEAGVPPAVFAVVLGDGVTGAALTASDVDKVSFTGSEVAGRRVAMACAARLVPYALELGGSDAAVVLEDADVGLAARGITWGRFTNAGQTCVAPKRVFVVGAAYEPFLRETATIVAAMGPAGADGAHGVGPLVRPSQARELEALLADAVQRGATIAARGAGGGPDGYVAPTLLADVTPAMRVMREETFGPLLPVARVASEAEAIERANASVYGLSASVWTADRARGVRVAERLHAGTVAVNDTVIVAGMAEVPHGGVKASGGGRAHGLAGLMECVQTRTVVAERMPGLPQVWWRGGGETAGALDAFLNLVHGRGVRARLGAVGTAMSLLRRARGAPVRGRDESR